MADHPDVIINLITYNRLTDAIRTIRSAKEHLIWPNVGWHIADDGSPEGYVDQLIEEIGPGYEVTVTNAQPERVETVGHQQVGKNMNLGAEQAFGRADFVLWLEDDWELREDLNLEPMVNLLQERPEIGMVRLGYLHADLEAEIIGAASKLWWLFKRAGHHYTFAGHPSLRHRRFYDSYGSYDEGLGIGATEDTFCSRFENKVEGPGIVWPAWLGERIFFDHFSFSWKALEDEGKL